MVDLQRGVQSYLIAKSSFEQDGYEQAPDTVRRPSQTRDPEGVPIAAVATPKKFGRPEKVSRGRRNFFLKGIGSVNPFLPCSAAQP
jgi:hypothetical protein